MKAFLLVHGWWWIFMVGSLFETLAEIVEGWWWILLACFLATPALAMDAPTGTVQLAPNTTVGLNNTSTVGIRGSGENVVALELNQEVGLVPGATVEIGGTSLFSLTGGICTVMHGETWLSVGAVSAVTVSPVAGQTAVTVVNRDPTRYMACTCDESAPLAPGHGEWLAPNGGFLRCPINDVTDVLCIASAAGGSANLTHSHESCGTGSPLTATPPESARRVSPHLLRPERKKSGKQAPKGATP